MIGPGFCSLIWMQVRGVAVNGDEWWYRAVILPQRTPKQIRDELVGAFLGDYSPIWGQGDFRAGEAVQLTLVAPAGGDCPVTDAETGAADFFANVVGVIVGVVDLGRCARASGQWRLVCRGSGSESSTDFWADTTRRDPSWFAPRMRSPDGRFILRYHALSECTMGGPLAGRIELLPSGYHSPGYPAPSFGGPPLWSTDSRYVAVPQWTQRPPLPQQRLVVFDVAEEREGMLPEVYEVLHVRAFVDGVISGTDSDRDAAKDVHGKLDDVVWRPFGSGLLLAD
jgi:hypothetical protein